ncbi:MAG: TlpA family protein disulfide reductase [Spirochaetia bacterium]|nr:TlpA family protein disulfide reductase [Spirochaetia bacterium]
MMKRLAVILTMLLASALFIGSGCSKDEVPAPAAAGGSVASDYGTTTQRPADAYRAPDFSIPSPDGSTVKLSDYTGKVVILDFWATWCPPCKAEIPFFIELYNEHKNDGLVLLGAALDEESKVSGFIRDFKVNYPTGIADQKLAMQYGGIRGIPTTFVIDREGYVVRQYVGFRPKQVFEQDFLALK